MGTEYMYNDDTATIYTKQGKHGNQPVIEYIRYYAKFYPVFCMYRTCCIQHYMFVGLRSYMHQVEIKTHT